MATASEISPPVIGEGQVGRRTRLIPILAFAAILGLGAVALVYFLFDPTKVAIFPPCMFHQVTGLDCPGCGAQRALHQLLRGHFIAAIRLNAMFVISLPLLAWMGFRFLRRKLRDRPIEANPRFWSAYLAAWIIFGVLRDLPFPVCQWFAA